MLRLLLAIFIVGCLYGAENHSVSAEDLLQVQRLFQQAGASYNANKFAESAEFLRKAIAIRDDALLRFNLACALARLGLKDDALTELSRSIELGNSAGDEIENESDLTSLRGDPRYDALLIRAKKKSLDMQGRLAKAPPVADLLIHPENTGKGSGARPLVVLLHGMGDTPRHFADAFRSWAQDTGFSLLAIGGSQALREDGSAYTWDYPADIERITQKVDAVLRQPTIDPKRVYLLGFSAGGSLSYAVSFTHPEIFRGVISASGSLEPGMLSEVAIKAASGKVPVVIIHGKQDVSMSFDLAQAAEERLRREKFAVMLHSFNGGHALPSDYRLVLNKAIAWIDGNTGK